MLNTSLWIAQVSVAAVMAAAGVTMIFCPRETLARVLGWAWSWEPWQIRMLGLVQLTAAVGLIVPTATGVAPFLTSMAAENVFLLMAGAVRTHQQRHESVVLPALLAGLSLFIAVGRIIAH